MPVHASWERRRERPQKLEDANFRQKPQRAAQVLHRAFFFHSFRLNCTSLLLVRVGLPWADVMPESHPWNSRSRSPWPPSLFYLFSCLYVVAALIRVEVLSELLEIVLTTIRLEEQQLLDGPHHKWKRQEASLFHIFWYFQCFLSLSLYELVDSVSAHAPVHPYHEYPFCAFMLWLPISPLHALSIASVSRLPIPARSVHPLREYPFSTFIHFVELLVSL